MIALVANTPVSVYAAISFSLSRFIGSGKLGGSTTMQEQHFVLIIQLHQFLCEGNGLVEHSLEIGGPVADLQDRQSRVVEIKNRLAGCFKILLWVIRWDQN